MGDFPTRLVHLNMYSIYTISRNVSGTEKGRKRGRVREESIKRKEREG